VCIFLCIGEWSAKRIENPDYKGPWVHPEIPNPNFSEQEDVYKRGPLGFVGFEVWQVKSGTVFGDFIVTDSIEEAKSFYTKSKVDEDKEKAAKETFDEANKPEEEEEDVMTDV